MTHKQKTSHIWYVKNRERILAKQRKRNKENPGRRAEYGKEYYRLHRKKAIKRDKERSLIRNYGITIKEKKQLWRHQNKKCALCGDKLLFKNSNVDHDHNTKKIRGVICRSCNWMLGHAHDSVEILEKAIQYLNKSGLVKRN